MRRAAVVATTALVAGLLLAPSQAQVPPTCEWKIGVMGALDGRFASYGVAASNGVRLAIDQTNESGDLACWLNLRAEDTGGDPNRAPRKAADLVGDDRLVACVCGLFSGETLASGQIFSEEGVAMLSTGELDVVAKQGFETWFRAIAPTSVQGAATARYIKRVLDPRDVAIVHDTQDYPRFLARRVGENLGNRFDGPYYVINPEEYDYSAVATQIKDQKPDVVFYGGYAQQAWPLLRQLREVGVRAKFITGGAAKERGRARQAGARDGLLSCECTDATKVTGAEAFVDAYRVEYGSDPNRHAPDAYDVTNIVIDALRELSGAEPIDQARAHVIAYLDAVEGAEGSVKSYAWDEKGELQADASHVWMWKWNGRHFVLVGRISELAD